MTAAPLPVPGALVATDLAFSYPGRHVFVGLSVRFEPGATWLRGANGSGKSTLLKLLAGALPPLQGRLSVAGIDAAAQPLAYRREVFWCGPGAIAFDHLRLPEWFAFLAGLYPRWDAAGVQQHAEALGLAPFAALRLSALSTGTQRKAWLAAALAVGTAAVLLDEPLNALDAASLAYLQAALRDAAAVSAQTWVLASHERPWPDVAGAGPLLREHVIDTA